MTTSTSTKKILGADIYAEAGAYAISVLENDKKAIKMIDALIAADIPPDSPAQPIRAQTRLKAPHRRNGSKR